MWIPRRSAGFGRCSFQVAHTRLYSVVVLSIVSLRMVGEVRVSLFVYFCSSRLRASSDAVPVRVRGVGGADGWVWRQWTLSDGDATYRCVFVGDEWM